MRLPARLRWSAPLGPRTELTETVDVSRSGVLVRAAEEHVPGALVWIAFPYDSSQGENQPEIATRVVRVKANGTGPRMMALEILNDKARGNANGSRGEQRQRHERRYEFRTIIAIPVWVRPEYLPWSEETMTLDASANGLRLVTTREYACGEQLYVRFRDIAPVGWRADREQGVRVIRMAGIGGGVSMEAAIRRNRAAE